MDSNKNIWIGTGGGLNKMIKGTENDVPRFINWRTTQSGLPNVHVYAVVGWEGLGKCNAKTRLAAEA
jgi:hypothetical protein